MAWVLLAVAGLLEVGWAIGLKYTQGFTRPWPSVFTVAAIDGAPHRSDLHELGCAPLLHVNGPLQIHDGLRCLPLTVDKPTADSRGQGAPPVFIHSHE